jgi:signal transduction histidine kinase
VKDIDKTKEQLIDELVELRQRIARLEISQMKDEEGKIIATLSSGENITERKRMEEERKELEQRVRQLSRLAAVGEMVSGIAHELNNPLAGVIGFAQLLLQTDVPENIRNEIKIIADGAQGAADIVKRLLTFAHPQRLERGYIDINDVIETTLALRAYEMKTSNIKVTTQLDPDLPCTLADENKLQQVFLNIIMNAEAEMKSARGEGNLLIETETIDNAIRISFKDDGPGIAKQNLEKIFDPFFTTREIGRGTGLGLSICHGIIAEHDGQIYAKSRLGRGATFIVELPIVTELK